MRCLAMIGLVGMAAPVAIEAQERSEASPGKVALRHQLSANPDDRAVMVNLAREYLRAGRTAKAHRLYRQVLAMDDVPLDRAGATPVSSHWLASQALRQTAAPKPVRLSSRRD